MLKAGLTALAAIALSTAASAQVVIPCAPTEGVAKLFADKYEQVPVWSGASQGQTYTLYMSGEGDWTMTRDPSPGVSCVFGFGEDARILGAPEPYVERRGA